MRFEEVLGLFLQMAAAAEDELVMDLKDDAAVAAPLGLVQLFAKAAHCDFDDVGGGALEEGVEREAAGFHLVAWVVNVDPAASSKVCLDPVSAVGTGVACVLECEDAGKGGGKGMTALLGFFYGDLHLAGLLADALPVHGGVDEQLDVASLHRVAARRGRRSLADLRPASGPRGPKWCAGVWRRTG